MSYATALSGMGDVLTDRTISALQANGASAAQAAKIASLMQRTPDGTTGNVDPQYASLVIHRDGTIGPASDAVIPPGDPSNYWGRIFDAQRYLVILNDQNNPITTVGAISIPAAQAILATYEPTPGSTTSQAQSTDATAQAEADAKAGTATAKTNAPVPTVSQPPAPPTGTPVALPHETYLPYGTVVVLSNGQKAYADGHGGLIAGDPPITQTSLPPGAMLATSTAIPQPFQSAPLVDPIIVDPINGNGLDFGPTDVGGNAPGVVPQLPASTPAVPSWALPAGLAIGAYLLLRGRRS